MDAESTQAIEKVQALRDARKAMKSATSDERWHRSLCLLCRNHTRYTWVAITFVLLVCIGVRLDVYEREGGNQHAEDSGSIKRRLSNATDAISSSPQIDPYDQTGLMQDLYGTTDIYNENLGHVLKVIDSGKDMLHYAGKSVKRIFGTPKAGRYTGHLIWTGQTRARTWKELYMKLNESAPPGAAKLPTHHIHNEHKLGDVLEVVIRGYKQDNPGALSTVMGKKKIISRLVYSFSSVHLLIW